ncbi:beta-L-arabinofuranosidase domain-containing protein [Microbacterium sp. SD291]|uniref:beta-L-arabinofuranosidase domain-containing protein n=1 Tax=Microbacterium sp. SD291 TaxID=2782007 RepID=UPI001A97059E|nr:beta-L-arabinofuranosidase domain-containing protein [Microbacterium sp. SD291]MBO0979636.1 glycoside hydrolase family 127 protein [Microbacterium sp. SD291]
MSTAFARLEDVTLADPYLRNAQEKTIAYLLELDAARLLYSFERNAGLEPTAAEGYGGWEREEGTRFQGHFFGHAMSAWSQAWATTRDERLLERIVVAIDGLDRCQRAYADAHPESAGYVSAFPVGLLPSGGDGLLVPFYNLHKMLAGLLDAHRHAPEEIGRTALGVASRFAAWIDTYAGSLEDARIILDTEYGGMNEALYRLYAVTGDPVHKRAAERFDETDLFRSLAAGEDVLAGRHANTTIPKLIGALARYTVLAGDPSLSAAERADLGMYRAAAENFWRIVVDRHTYANGANSQSEHFHAPGTLHARANSGTTTGYGENSTAEGCNEYNMLKLSRALFALTGDVKYADYDESTFLNSVLAAQNPETGMVTYFQPQRAGYAKVFGRPFDQFWCDHGTGVESFTKLGDDIYAVAADAVTVNRFRSGELRLSERNLRLTVSADIPRESTVRLAVSSLDGGTVPSVTLRLRAPSWLAAPPTLTVNGERREAVPVRGYLAVEVTDGDEIEYTLPAEVRLSAGTENENWVAFTYGPVLLATALSRENVDATYTAGVLVEMGLADPALTGTVVVDDPAAWRAGIRSHLVRLDDGENANGIRTMRFALRGVDAEAAGWVWEPYYSLYGARYATYVTLVARGAERDASATADDVIDALSSFDNNNSEADKNHRFHASTIGVREGAQYREASADAGAYFEYALIVDPAGTRLGVTYSGQDAGRTFDVFVNDVLLRREVIEDPNADGGLYERIDDLPPDVLAGGRFKRDQRGGFLQDPAGRRIPVVTVRFQSTGGSPVGGVYGVRTLRG